MATLDIFASFEFDKDKDLSNNFFEQSKLLSPHRVRNFSLKEDYPDVEWKRRARSAIAECDLVIVLVGQDTHNAPGVKIEVDMARGMGKPVFQVIPQGRPYTGLSYVDDRIRWKWPRINTKIDEVWTKRRRG